MANNFKDTVINGDLTVTGEITGLTNTLAQLAIANFLGVTSSSTGCIGGGQHTTVLKVTAQGTPDLTVRIAAGTCFIAGIFTGDSDGVATLSGFAAPSANPRIDIVQIANDGTITRKAGTENASPTAPTVDANNMKLAEVYCRVGMTSVKNTDDSSNGYITDSRVFV